MKQWKHHLWNGEDCEEVGFWWGGKQDLCFGHAIFKILLGIQVIMSSRDLDILISLYLRWKFQAGDINQKIIKVARIRHKNKRKIKSDS